MLDGRVDKKALLKLTKDCQKIMAKESNLMQLNGEVVMVGDIHGQFYDMVSMLDRLTPQLEQSERFHLLFLGDYVDRGIHGIEVLIFLMALKINYPKQVIMMRGNHESRSMTTYFTFRQECLDKYDAEVYE